MSSAILRFAEFELQPDARRLLVRGRPVQVGARAYDLLVALIERSDRVVSKHELLDTVWPNLVVEENNLQVHIHALRRLLGPTAITTIPGRGYRFTAEASGATRSASANVGDDEALWNGARSERTSGTKTLEGNLPASIPDLYGRDEAVAQVTALLDLHRLVTITGSSGIGKTRLAQTVAHRLRERFPNGVWMIELAAVQDATQLASVIAQMLDITLTGNRSPFEALAAALQSQHLMLVLDNCEHLVDPVAQLVSRLLSDAPSVRILTTSQELLRITGEQIHRLDPLSVPTERRLDGALGFGAVRLFVERARALDGNFELTQHNLDAVVSICNRLEGIALAIELAAARVPSLGVQGIHDRLGERLRVLTGGARVSLRRHQTLRAALDWSHQLLTERESRVFRRLAVFSDGFVIEGAQVVGRDDDIDEWALLDVLGALVDKSLVLVDSGERPRYRMLETTRSYALEKLAEAGETDIGLKHHAEATDALCRMAVKQRDSELLWAEMNNIRTAYAWAIADGGNPLLAISLATASAMPLAVSGLVDECLKRLLEVEALVDDRTPRALAARYWQWVGRAGLNGRLPTSRCIAALGRAEAVFAELGSERHVHGCKRARAESLIANKQFDEARAALKEAEEMERIGWPLADRMRRLRVLGLLHTAEGRYELALETSQLALDMADSAGMERYVLILLNDIASLHLQMSNAEVAAQEFSRLAMRAEGSRSQGLTLAQGLAGLVAALIVQSQLEQAAVVGKRALPLLRRSGNLLLQCDFYSWLAARRGRFLPAAMLLGAADTAFRSGEVARDGIRQRAREEAMKLLTASESDALLDKAMAQGAAAGEDEIATLIESALAQASA